MSDADVSDAVRAALLANQIDIAVEIATTYDRFGTHCLWCSAPSIGVRAAPDSDLNPLVGYLCVECFGQAAVRALFRQVERRRQLQLWRERLAQLPEDTAPTPRAVDD